MDTATRPKYLRIKAQINGTPRLQGIFTMRDQEGFPIDMAYEMAKEMGAVVDWVEAMADALRQSVTKYKSLVEEIRLLDPEAVTPATGILAAGINSADGADLCERAENLYRKMHQ